MNNEFIIYHNGDCSKSKGALELLQEHNIPHRIRWYLVEPLTEQEIKDILNKLSLPAEDIIRKNEALFKERFEDKILSSDEWIAILAAYPALLERPIVEKGANAIIARPPEKVLEFVQSVS